MAILDWVKCLAHKMTKFNFKNIGGYRNIINRRKDFERCYFLLNLFYFKSRTFL